MSIVFEVSKCVDCPVLKEGIGTIGKAFCEDGKFYIPVEELSKISKFCPHMSKEEYVKSEIVKQLVSQIKPRLSSSDTCPRSCELPSTSNQNTHETMGC